MPSETYANINDLSALIGPITGQEEIARAQILLEYAALAIRRAYQRYGKVIDSQDADGVLARKAVNCYIVKRIMDSDGYADLTNASTTVGSFTESFTFANPDGSIYMRKTDYELLGLNRGRL